jgi:hypothetical protein
MMRFHPKPDQVDPNSLLRGACSSPIPPTRKKVRTVQNRGTKYNKQEGGSVGSFVLATGGIPPSLAVSGEGLTGSVSDSF